MSATIMEKDMADEQVKGIYGVIIKQEDCDGITSKGVYIKEYNNAELAEENCVEIKEEHIDCENEVCHINSSNEYDIDGNKIFLPIENDNVNQTIENDEKVFISDVQDPLLVVRERVENETERKFQKRRYTCGVCNKQFLCKGDLAKHRSQHKDNPYRCEICRKIFSTRYFLERHNSVHTKIKPFSCEICGHTFSQKVSLNTYNRIHTKEKPYGCEVCGKAFSQKGNLGVHKRIHRKEKPYVCEVCGKAFISKAHLKRHKSIHS